MKAAIHTKYGSPEVVSVMEVEKPTPKDNEVLIRVHVATVNRTDCGFRSAEYFISRFFSGLFKPNNQILGNEFSGVIEAIGKEVTNFNTGDKVFCYNDTVFGAHAQYMLMPENGAMATMPPNISFEVAAPICEGAHYALADIRAANVTAGQNVLVYGATGAIGSAAVQLLKHFGATVTAVCATPHLELVKSLGADVVIDYTKEDFTNTNQTFDFIFDAVGKSSFSQCKKILTPKGIYISTEFGAYGANVWHTLLTPLLGGKRVLFPLPTINKADVLLLKSLVEAGTFKPLIDRKYPLAQIVAAYQYVETHQKTGNVLITMV
jgi:NADPH:quinone reductase-like Zn-dependent oxidoreductase